MFSASNLPLIAGGVVGVLLLLLILVVVYVKFTGSRVTVVEAAPKSFSLPKTNEQKARDVIAPVLGDIIDKRKAAAYLDKLAELHGEVS